MQLIPDGYLREPAENVANAASRTRVSPATVQPAEQDETAEEQPHESPELEAL